MKTKLIVAAVALVLIAGVGAVALRTHPNETRADKPFPPAAPAAPAAAAFSATPEAEALDPDDFEMGTAAPPEPESDDVQLEASELPVKVHFAKERVMGVSRELVVVQAVADDVTVNAVKLNRGNCRAAPSPQSGETLPAKLKFGQALHLVIHDCDRVLEVAVDTDTGEHTFGT